MMLPTIKAEFVLDNQGKPKGRDSGNYLIQLRVTNVPSDAYKVTYQLDSSYYDPLREVLDSASDFSEMLTSYGDYVVVAKVRLTDHTISTSRGLWDALMESHAGSAEQTIKKALKDIETN